MEALWSLSTTVRKEEKMRKAPDTHTVIQRLYLERKSTSWVELGEGARMGQNSSLTVPTHIDDLNNTTLLIFISVMAELSNVI